MGKYQTYELLQYQDCKRLLVCNRIIEYIPHRSALLAHCHHVTDKKHESYNGLHEWVRPMPSHGEPIL